MHKSLKLLSLLFVLVALAGCGEEMVFRSITLAPGSSECAAGGVRFEWGDDENGNGQLDDGEVTGSSLSCNVPLLITTETVAPGQRGCNEGGIAVIYGHDTNSDGVMDVVQSEIVHCNSDEFLVRTEDIAAGAGSVCPYGGIMLYFGPDQNGNNYLDAEEVIKEEKICQQRVDGYSNLVEVTPEAPGANCPSGGSKYSTGLDLNQNLELENEEVLYTSYSCHGDSSLMNIESIAPGEICETGGIMVHSGVDRNVNGVLDNSERNFSHPVCNGRTSLVRVDSVAPGAVCEQGGIRVYTGFDRNADSVLSNDEISSSEVVCDGVDGLTSLITLTELPIDLSAGCQFGGTRIQSGLDVNRNGTLESGEVMHSNDVCKVQVNENQNVLKFSETYPEDGICEFGGVITQVGLDTNNNRVLDPSEVTSTAVNCNEVMIVDGKTTLSRTRVAGTSACQFGGFYLDMGLDDNRNGTLETAEVDNTQLICNGHDGYNSLTRYESYSGAVCGSAGGYRIHTGLDTNRNGTLETLEVTHSNYICNGERGEVGLSMLVETVDYSGFQCGTNGGVEIRSGLDTNRDGSLQSGEITRRSYVCNGEDGFDGSDGADALVETTEGTYAFCDGGFGVRIDSGTDYNYNGVLDASEVFSTSYVCDGFDGENGLDGVDGGDGFNGLVEVTGGNYSACDGSWGILIEAGTDYDGDGYLDSDEVSSSEVLCEFP